MKCDELNAHKADVTIPVYGTIADAEVYLKAEADKVIAEKDEQIDLYKRGWEESDRINEHLYAQLRHANYKRCLAMVERCDITALYYGNLIPKVLDKDIADADRQKVFRRFNHYKKWYKCWLALAEEPTWAKFLQIIHKEAK